MWALKASIGAVLLSSILAAQVSEHASSQQGSAGETQLPGNPRRGQALFEGKGSCTSCHRIGETGSALGPNLTEIATRLTGEQLRKSLLDPDPTVPPTYQRYRVVTRDGKAISGKLLNQDAYSLQMIDSDNRLVAFERSQLREWGFIQTPPMPSYRETLSPEELADLLAYLASLNGAIHP